MAKPTRLVGAIEPLHIFQNDVFERQMPMTSYAPMPAVTKPARRPLSGSNANVVLNPPCLAANASFSPHKTQSSSPRSPLESYNGSKLNMVAIAPPVSCGPTTDSLQKKPQISNFKQAAMPHPSHQFSRFGGKENLHPPPLFPAPAPINLSVDNYYAKPDSKRNLLDAAPIKDARPPNKRKSDDSALPPHDSFPPVQDDGNKPTHSYAQLIGMAILRSPLRRLTLAQIYKWISDNYSFYSPNDTGWQNSIRHNLSLHKNFIKIERPKDDPGKGNYWGIEPGTESQFLKEKPTRKSAPTAENVPVMSTRLEPSRPAQEPTLPAPPPPSPCMPQQVSLPPLPLSVPKEMANELSSDATIPISDNVGPEEPTEKTENEHAAASSLYSHLPPNMDSSPPIARNAAERPRDTPPSAALDHASSNSRSRKRRLASMEDSGYISSLESSAMRPNPKALLLTSEADRPRIKRGRAEEEIARLRGSSPFSPTKSRSLSTYGPVSSPLRPVNDNQMLPPLTPVIKMKPPIRPPLSASPNTNLRIHRDTVSRMLQSPLCRVTGLSQDSLPWSPAFNLDHTLYPLDDDESSAPTGFDIFNDMVSFDDAMFGGSNTYETGSPMKRSAKRSRLDRSISASALVSITNSANKKPSSSALPLKFSTQSPCLLETPSKMFAESPIRNASPGKYNSALDLLGDGTWPCMNFEDLMSHEDIAPCDFSGLDILQGFEKIGSGPPASKQPKLSKPPLGRSLMSRF